MHRCLVLVLLWGCATGDVDTEVDAIVGMTPVADCPRDADCGSRICGPDPVCGLSCGTCPDDGVCTDGRCGCVPDCDGRTCRPDGCGGICEGCPDGQACRNGACVAADACPDAAACGARTCGPDPVCQTDCGACPEGRLCQDGQCADAPAGCPEIADCGARTCGPDPVCGTDCGACDGDCIDGECAVDACGARVCGPDGMGGDCGTCPDGQRCADGQCVCVPDCDARVCGDDGCGGVCGECPAGVACEAGACACDPRWARPIEGQVRGAFEHGPHVIAYGTADGSAHAWVFDLCGNPVNDAPVALPGAEAPIATVGHPIGPDILLGGALSVAQGEADIDSALVRLTVPDLTEVWSRTIDLGPAQSTVLDVATDAQGELWFTGSQGFFPNLTGRIGLLGDDGAHCHWPPLASDTNATQEVTTSPDRETIYISAIDAPDARIERFDAGCLLAAQCACVPDANYPLPGVQASGFTAVSGLEASDDALYLTIYWFTDGFREMRGEVRRVPLAGGEQAIFVWNPTQTFDFLYDLVLTPGGARVAASRGFAVMGQQPGDAVILAFDAAFGEPVEHLVGPGLLVDLAVGRGALYAVRTVDQQSVLHRCDPSGACAP